MKNFLFMGMALATFSTQICSADEVTVRYKDVTVKCGKTSINLYKGSTLIVPMTSSVGKSDEFKQYCENDLKPKLVAELKKKFEAPNTAVFLKVKRNSDGVTVFNKPEDLYKNFGAEEESQMVMKNGKWVSPPDPEVEEPAYILIPKLKAELDECRNLATANSLNKKMTKKSCPMPPIEEKKP